MVAVEGIITDFSIFFFFFKGPLAPTAPKAEGGINSLGHAELYRESGRTKYVSDCCRLTLKKALNTHQWLVIG
jgi:hypothetical protein